MVTVAGLAEELGVKLKTLEYHVKRGRIPRPDKFGWQNVWSEEQAQEARLYWKAHVRYQHFGKEK
jgi:hypothetical protein